MPLDERYYRHFVSCFMENMKLIFYDTMIPISKKYGFRYKGIFRLTYKYLPHNYKIVIENEFTSYNIIIYDAEGASNELYHIEQFNNSLGEDNIRNALVLLKKVLEENNFDFYFRVDDKLYRKNAEGIKRIEDKKKKMERYKDWDIKITHFYCLEYYEGDKTMVVEMDFRETPFYLSPQMIKHWEKPYEDVEITAEDKKRILQNIRQFLLDITIPSRIIMEDM